MNDVVEVRGELYTVKRRIKISNNPIVENWKEVTHSDIVFKHEPSGYYLFCNLISQPEVIYEESENESTDASSDRASDQSNQEQ
jgi:hypothetical protein